MKNLIYLLFAAIVLFTSCSGNLKTSDDGYYSQDFDNLKMWTQDANVTREQAHSGSFSAFTDSTHEYSQTFEMDFSYAKSKGYNSMMLTAWCYMTDLSINGGLVASVEDSEKSLAYLKTDFSEFMEVPNTWKKVSASFKLPESSMNSAKIKVYVWVPGKQKTFVDDVEIQFNK